MTLRPSKNIQKALLSTTSCLAGEFEMDGVLITNAWPNFSRWPKGPTSRSAFVFAFQTEDVPVEYGSINDYSPMGDLICAYLAVLFGKRFDHHGLIEGSGIFHVPDLVELGHFCRHELPHNSDKPRPDFDVPLNLAEVQRIKPLLVSEAIDRKFLRTFRTCSKFYLQALQNAERDPEVAYLHLITSGEILSNFYEYDKAELLDEDTKDALEAIERDVSDGARLVRIISNKLLQIKRRFMKTLSVLIDEAFFTKSEASNLNFGFKRDSFINCMGSAYDLRSKYVHTGIPFRNWILFGNIYEVLGHTPNLEEDRELAKIIGNAPTFIGLERVMRYALLKFAEKHDAYLAQPAVQPDGSSGSSG